jgi:uncharacterized protein (DUF983 family)
MAGTSCPRCGTRPLAAFFKPHFICSKCGTRLSSNLRAVSLTEWLVGAIPLMLIAAALLKTDVFMAWSFAQILLLLLVPACIVHWVVIRRYLRLTAHASQM